MICRLPKENALLLRYLLAVLHGIQGNAQENQMTTFNLSVCIAPSMLWPPGVPCSPEVEGEGTKKVSVEDQQHHIRIFVSKVLLNECNCAILSLSSRPCSKKCI